MTGSGVPAPPHSVRPAQPPDARSIARIQGASMRLMLPPSSQIAVDDGRLAAQWTATLSAPAPPGCLTLVALHADTVVGFAAFAPAEEAASDSDVIGAGAEILDLAVDERFRRSGHASRLMSAVADLSEAPTLRIWIASGDEARLRFFHSCGFAPSSSRRRLPVGEGEPLVQHLWWAGVDEGATTD